MKWLALSVLLSIGLTASAQNWQWFPSDSLRVYNNPIQHEKRLTGLDLRHYTILGDTTVFDLSQFSRVDTIEHPTTGPPSFVAYYIHGNSNFGNHILETDQQVTLVFKHLNEDSDSFVFYKTAERNEPWTIYANDTFSLTGNVDDRLLEDDDSVMVIGLTLNDETTENTLHASLTISKEFGLKRTPVFYEILQHSTGLQSIDPVEFVTYREMTKLEFFTCAPGTIIEFDGSYRDEPDRIDFVRRDSFIRQVGNKVHYQSIVHAKRTGPGHFPETNFTDSIRIEEFNTTMIFNPIPGKLWTSSDLQSRGFLYDAIGGYFECGRYVHYFTGSYRPYEFRNDTVYIVITVVMPPVLGYNGGHYMEGIGIIDEDEIHCIYFHIPDECSRGERHWKFGTTPINVVANRTIFPNPASSYVFVHDNPDLIVELHSASGTFIPINKIGNRIEFEAATGLYYLSLFENGKISHQPLFIVPQ